MTRSRCAPLGLCALAWVCLSVCLCVLGVSVCIERLVHPIHLPMQSPQLERKRHLGNDIVMFVFMDEGCKEPFDPSQIRSQFNHIFIVVQPERRKGVTRYKCAQIITRFLCANSP